MCTDGTSGRADALGAIDIAVPLTARIGWIDCRVPTAACYLRAMIDSESFRVDLAFDPAGPAPARASVVVTPSTGLDDGDLVRVSATGLTFHHAFAWGDHANYPIPPDGSYWVQVFECGVTGEPACTPIAVGLATGDALDVMVRVRATTSPGSGTGPDCRSEPCELVVGYPYDERLNATTSIAFDPAGTLDPPTLEVTPDTGLAGNRTVQLHGTGFTPGWVHIDQCYAVGADTYDWCARHLRGWALVGIDGILDAEYEARSAISIGGYDTDCSVSPALCALAVAPMGARDPRDGLLVPLSFGPPPPPTSDPPMLPPIVVPAFTG